jgi:hypothetical protein
MLSFNFDVMTISFDFDFLCFSKFMFFKTYFNLLGLNPLPSTKIVLN